MNPPLSPHTATPDRDRETRRTCLEAWPEAVAETYDLRCCRFPKLCSCPPPAPEERRIVLRGPDHNTREEWMPVAEHAAVVAERDRLREALARIRDREWFENVLNPQWAPAIAREALGERPADENGGDDA